MRNKTILNTLILTSATFSAFCANAQVKSLDEIKYEAKHHKAAPSDKSNIIYDKYTNTNLTEEEKEHYREIDRKNNEALQTSKQMTYMERIELQDKLNKKNTPQQTMKIGPFSAPANTRSIGQLVNSWSGRDGFSTVIWNMRQDYNIVDVAQFNKRSEIWMATNIQTAIDKILYYVAVLNANQQDSVSIKACYESNTIRIVEYQTTCKNN